MPHRIDTFPFTDISDEEAEATMQNPAASVNEVDTTTIRILEEYGQDGGEAIEHMLAQEGIEADLRALSYGLAHDTWVRWQETGFPRRGVVADDLLHIAYFWVGLAMRSAFLAGVAYEQGRHLEQLLEGVDLSGLGGGNDVG